MKKVFLLATAFLFVTGVALADKGKKKKCAKGKLRVINFSTRYTFIKNISHEKSFIKD